MRTVNRTPENSIRKSPFLRFVADESGQGILFAAATLLVLIGFVAFVFNIGRLLDRRTKVQVAADAAAYSGAMIEANAVSTIAWINSAMSQVYYNSLKYAVDVNEASVAAELERRMNASGQPGGPAWQAYTGNIYPSARAGLLQAKQWIVQLSQIENAIAIVTPRLVQEEMFTVAARAGGERMSVYPSFRMFPSADSLVQFTITRLGNGWQVVNLTTGATLTVTQNGNSWDFQWGNDASSSEVTVTQNPGNPPSWSIQFFQPPGSLTQEVSIVDDPNLGWVVSGTGTNPNGGPPIPMQPITFQTVPVTLPGGTQATGTQITQNGTSQVLYTGPDGNVYLCSPPSNVVSSTPLTQNQTTIGGVNVQANVTNTIKFPGATAHIGQPTTVDIGGAHIVLSNPPTITTGMNDVSISISGLNASQFNISCGGFSLTPNSNGRWVPHYDSREEIWWRNQLISNVGGNPNQWQYNRERFGALLQPEPDSMRIAQHAFMGQGFSSNPADWPTNSNTLWAAWFNPDAGQAIPYHLQAGNNAISPHDLSNFTKITRPDGSYYYEFTPNPQFNLLNDYYQTQYGKNQPCPICGGLGGSWQTVNGQRTWVICPNCRGEDYDGDGITDIRVYVDDLPSSPAVLQWVASQVNKPLFPNDYYVNAPMFLSTTSGYTNPQNGAFQLPGNCWPLVAYDDFFKWGVNIGVWKHAFNGVINPNDTPMPMMYPDLSSPEWKWEPPWGTVAIASARVGLSTANGGVPAGAVALPLPANAYGSYLYQFSDKADRTNWCQSSLQNLYYADVHAQIFATKNQVLDIDLDPEDNPDNSLNGQSGLSFLWNSILSPNSWNNRNDWMDRFNGQSDPRVGQYMGSMQNRQGAAFDYGSGNLNQVVEH